MSSTETNLTLSLEDSEQCQIQVICEEMSGLQSSEPIVKKTFKVHAKKLYEPQISNDELWF